MATALAFPSNLPRKHSSKNIFSRTCKTEAPTTTHNHRFLRHLEWDGNEPDPLSVQKDLILFVEGATDDRDEAAARLLTTVLHPMAHCAATPCTVLALLELMQDQHELSERHHLIRLLIATIGDIEPNDEEKDETQQPPVVLPAIRDAILSGIDYYLFLANQVESQHNGTTQPITTSPHTYPNIIEQHLAILLYVRCISILDQSLFLRRHKQQITVVTCSDQPKEETASNGNEPGETKPNDTVAGGNGKSDDKVIRTTAINESEEPELGILLQHVFPPTAFESYCCDICTEIILGTRIHCNICENFDLCQQCSDIGTFPASHLSDHDTSSITDNSATPEERKELSSIRRQILLELAHARNSQLWIVQKTDARSQGGNNQRGRGNRGKKKKRNKGGRGRGGGGDGRGRGQSPTPEATPQTEPKNTPVTPPWLSIGELLARYTPITTCSSQNQLLEFVARVFVQDEELEEEEEALSALPACTACHMPVDAQCFICTQGCNFGLCAQCVDSVDHPHPLEEVFLETEDAETTVPETSTAIESD